MKRNLSRRINKILLYIPVIFCCLLALACNRENGVEPISDETNRVPIQLGASVNLQTRATNTGFELNDSIGLYLTKWQDNSTFSVLSETGNYTDNALFRLNALPDSWTADQMLYYPADGSKLDFYAYYPYREPAFGTGTILNLSVASNQSAYRDYTHSDFMMAKTQGVKRSTGKVHLDFYHRLAQIVFVLKPGTGFTANDLMNAKVKIVNAIIDGTFDLSRQTDTVPVPGTTRQDVTPCGSWTEDNGNLRGMMAILMPQNINTSTYIEVTMGSRKFNFKPAEAIHMNSGCSREFTITVNNTGIDIETEIHPWNTCPAVNGEAEEEETFDNTMSILNKYCKDNGLMFITGTTYHVDDDRIPFQACDTFLNVKKYGVVLEDGTVKIWDFTQNYGTKSVAHILRAPMLLDNIMAISYGEGSKGNCYLGVVDINTGTVIGSSDSYKYTVVYHSMYKSADGTINFYFDAFLQTHRYMMTMTVKESSVTFQSGNEYAYNGFTANTYPLEVTDSYAKGVVLSTQDYSTFWIRTTTNVNDLPNSSSGTTVATLTNKAVFGYIGLKTPEHNGFVCWDQNTNLYEWWSIDGTLIKTLDNKPDTEHFVYRYKNGKIYRSTLGSIKLNQYVESNY